MPGFFSPARWAASQSPVALLVVRLLIVANIGVLGVVGALCLAFVARPAGIVIALVVWGAVAALFALLPYTNPRRRRGTRW